MAESTVRRNGQNSTMAARLSSSPTPTTGERRNRRSHRRVLHRRHDGDCPGDRGSSSSTGDSGSSPSDTIEQTTTINAPVHLIWHALVSVDDWSWNDSIRFRMNASSLRHGSQGEMCDGDKKRGSPCIFQRVDRVEHVLRWTSHRRSLIMPRSDSECTLHTMQLTGVDANTTSLLFTETVERAHSGTAQSLLSQGKKKQQQQRNARRTTILRFSQSLKLHAETMHFNQRVMSFSSQKLYLDDDCSDGNNASGHSKDCDDCTEGTALSSTYWESPALVRRQIAACYLTDSAGTHRSASVSSFVHDANEEDDDDGKSIEGIGALPF